MASRGGQLANRPKATTDYELRQRLRDVAKDLQPAGVPLEAFLAAWNQLHPGQPLQSGIFTAEDVIRQHGGTHLRVANKTVQGRRVSYVLPRPTQDEVNNAVKNTCKQLHDAGMPVTTAAVDRALAATLCVNSLEDLGVQPRTLPAIQDLMFKERTIHTSTAAYLACRDIATLADLEAYLCSLLKVETFNQLQMGPLLVNELVLANFKPPSNVVQVPQVTVIDVVKAISDAKQNTPRTQRVEWSAVHDALAAAFGVGSFSELCVRLPQGICYTIENCIKTWEYERVKTKESLRCEVLGLNRVLAQARAELKQLVQCRVAVLVAEAQQQAFVALENFKANATTVLQTQLLLQPITYTQLQAAISAALQPVEAQTSSSSARKTKKSSFIKPRTQAISCGIVSASTLQQSAASLSATAVLLAGASWSDLSKSTDGTSTSSSSSAPATHFYEGLKLTAFRQLFSDDVERISQALQPLAPAALRQLLLLPEPPPPPPQTTYQQLCGGDMQQQQELGLAADDSAGSAGPASAAGAVRSSAEVCDAFIPSQAALPVAAAARGQAADSGFCSSKPSRKNPKQGKLEDVRSESVAVHEAVEEGVGSAPAAAGTSDASRLDSLLWDLMDFVHQQLMPQEEVQHLNGTDGAEGQQEQAQQQDNGQK